MNCIVNVDNNWGIGLKNKLLVSIPADLRFFQSKTKGKVVIFGRSTLETFPGGMPLKNRLNIVISRNPNYSVPDALVAHSVEEAIELASEYASEDVFVIGGASVYRQFLPYCDTAYVTRTDYCYDADTHFPNLDADPEWECIEEGEEQTYYDIVFRFTKYVRKDTPSTEGSEQ
ncbi:MAG: dihydrofolate reductase [Lachnospiraceae bacterium]|nr:dihydrofolate reductase [Lachnospiraceae bacterium]